MPLDTTTFPLPLARHIADVRTIVRAWKAAGQKVALIPTMGALHDGHLSLVRLARQHASFVVVSIFVNPTQFAPHEDFAAYPRTEKTDAEKLARLQVDLLFSPSAQEMYGQDFSTTITPKGAALGLESDFRPHFFAGVATVVTKLFNQCQPDVTLLGEKDYQQLLVIRQVTRDLDLPVTIIGGPTLREADGLAMSSRNIYLSGPERATAASLNKILKATADAIASGTSADEACTKASADLLKAGFASVDYVSARDGETLGPYHPAKPGRVLAAAWLGRTRLIDNLPI